MEGLPPYEQPLFDPPPHGGPIDSGQKPQKPGSNKTLLIVLVVVGLLLLCCGIGGLLAFLAVSNADEVATVQAPAPPPYDAPNAGPEPVSPVDEEARLAEWAAWEPALGSVLTTAPTERQVSIADQVAAAVLGEARITELLVEPGYYDEQDGLHIADTYYFKATVQSAPLAFYFWATPRQWADMDVSWDESTVESYRTLASLPDGTQYEYEHDSFAPAMGGAPSAIYVDLLQTVAEDWPDAVCVWATFVGDSVEYAAAYVTTWESFMDDAPFTGAEVYYVLQDGQWLVDEWDWYAE